jgi:zinc protease
MKLRFFSGLFFVLYACISPAAAEVVSKKYMLENGLTVIINEMPSTQQAAIYVWIKTGSANEGKFQNSGITHFIEHMLFKGTEKRGTGIIPQEARSIGGIINASTSYDFTVYTLNLPRENFSAGLDLMADMVTNPVFDPAELEKEREVIVKEMRMINDRPEWRLDNLLYSTVYTRHPYRFPIIGHETIFRNLTRDNLLEYFHLWYLPGNMILTVSGNFTAESIIDEIRAKFSGNEIKSMAVRDTAEEPVQIFPRSAAASYATDLYRYSIAFQGVPLLHPDLYAMDVLAMALGDGESSRLYTSLYQQKKLVTSVSASNLTPIDRGFFEISCLMDSDHSEEVLAHVKNTIATVRTNGLTRQELETVKRKLMVQNIASRQTAGGMAYKTGIETAFTADHLFSDKYLDGIRAVTNADIKRVASQYLIDARMTTVSLFPETTAPLVSAETPASSAAERYLLDNGLRLILKEDHALPFITVRVALNGGTRQETTDKTGSAFLAGALWGRAFKGKTVTQLSSETEARGGSISSYSGKNSLILAIDFLSEDTDLVLGLLENFLKKPSFPQEELELYKKQMISSVKSIKDSPLRTATKLAVETLFETHPFRNDGLGDEAGIARLSRQDALDFFEDFFSADGMVISIFGDINKKAVLDRLGKSLSVLPEKRKTLAVFDEPAPETPRIKEIAMPKEQAVLVQAFRGPWLDSKERFAGEVAMNVLTSSLGGRLFKRIREEMGQAYTLGGSFSPGVDAGMFLFYVNTSNEYLEKVRAILEEEIRRLAVEPLTVQELTDTKNYLISRQGSGMETLAAQATASSINELLGLGFDQEDSYNSNIMAVSAEDVRSLAERWLNPEHAALVIVRSQQP